jgi:antitoxin component YwqK of YwqJK toxin-antitoxin module
MLNLFNINNTMSLVYKSCHPYIVTLEKLPDTKTNECRKDIKFPQYAKYRANKLLVKSIIHKLSGEEIDEIKNTIYHKKITYTKNQIIKCDNYDENIDVVRGAGIHYYLSKEVALNLELSGDHKYNGLYNEWYDNGQLEYEGYFNGSTANGSHKVYNINGKLISDKSYVKGLIVDDAKF